MSKLHRVYATAVNGLRVVISEAWRDETPFKKLAPSPDGGPNYKSYFLEKDKQGSVSVEIYLDVDGQMHRTDGPAHITYNKDGEVTNAENYFHGKMLSELATQGLIVINDDGSIPEDTWFTLSMMDSNT